MPYVDLEMAGEMHSRSCVLHRVLFGARSYADQVSIFPSLPVAVEVADPAAVKVELPSCCHHVAFPLSTTSRKLTLTAFGPS
jgi:hypothetical protein